MFFKSRVIENRSCLPETDGVGSNDCQRDRDNSSGQQTVLHLGFGWIHGFTYLQTIH